MISGCTPWLMQHWILVVHPHPKSVAAVRSHGNTALRLPPLCAMPSVLGALLHFASQSAILANLVVYKRAATQPRRYGARFSWLVVGTTEELWGTGCARTRQLATATHRITEAHDWETRWHATRVLAQYVSVNAWHGRCRNAVAPAVVGTSGSPRLLKRSGKMLCMSNIAAVLKQEVTRLARKQLRAETLSSKKAVSAYRAEIATLKRRVLALEKHSASANKHLADPAPASPAIAEMRHRPEGLKKHRQRLGLSAAEVARILQVSALSVYKWESGKIRPRPQQLAKIARLRTMGKRDVAKLLAQAHPEN